MKHRIPGLLAVGTFIAGCLLGGASAQAQFFQQAKLIGTGAIGPSGQGSSVALSASGSTAMVGGPFDNYDVGAAWVFKRSGGVWTQQAKLVGTGAIGDALQGNSVSLSASGSTAIVGGPWDTDRTGAAWVFVRFAGLPRSASCHGQSVSALAQQYGGFGSAAAALGYSSVQAMQNGVAIYCAG